MLNYDKFAEIYDWDMGANIGIQDLNLYLKFAESPILELGCGTGRLTIPFALHGHEIWGLDLSEKMLEKCKSKIPSEIKDRIHLSQGDMSNFNFEKKFGFCFIAFSSFLKLLTKTDQESCLSCVYNHLRPEGKLIIDIFKPDFYTLSTNELITKHDYTRLIKPGVIVSRSKKLHKADLINQINELTLYYEMTSGKSIAKWELQDKVRYVFFNEMVLLLEHAGFNIDEVFGSYELGKLTDDSQLQIFVVRKGA